MSTTGGGNFPQVKATTKSEVLLYHILQCIGSLGGGGGGGGLATEATQLSVLSAIDSMRDYEVRLVADSDTPSVTWLEVRYWDAQSGALGAPVYYPPGSTTPGVPVAPLSYINPTSLLTQLVSNTAGINLEATQLLVKGVLDNIKLDTANLDVALSTIASEATLALVEGDTDALATPVTGLATSLTRVTVAGAGAIGAGKRRASFFNAGNNDATVNGATLKRGESVAYSADGLRDVLADITYDCLTSELLITTVG